MAQRTIEVASVRRTDNPVAISRTDGGFRAFSPADPHIGSEHRPQHPTAMQLSPAAEALARDHLHLVNHVARNLVHRLPAGVELDELVGDGYVGLVLAARTFVPARGISFRAFARYRVRGAMLDGLRERDPRSRHMLAQYRAVEHAISGLSNVLGRIPAEDEIATSMGLGEERWRKLRRCLNAAGYILFLDPLRRPAPAPDELSAAAYDPAFLIAQAARLKKLIDALQMIPPRYRAVISMYYARGRTMTEIAMRLGVNESRVSQIHKRAIAILRAKLSADESDLRA